MGRIIRRALVRVVRVLVLRPAAAAGIGALLVAGVAALVLVPALLASGGGTPRLGISLPRPSQGEPSATEGFLKGNRDFNAEMVWQSFSDEARQQLGSAGGSPQAIQQQMDLARQRGRKIEEFSYIGSKELPNGSTMAFYVVGVRQQPNADVEFVPYLFTLDSGGKIAKVQ